MISLKRNSLGASLTWAYKGSDQTVSSGAEDLISFNSEVQDDAGLHDNATFNSRMTAARTGMHSFSWRVVASAANSGAVGKLAIVNVYKNGTKILDADVAVVGTSNSLSPAYRATICGSAMLLLNATDYVELKLLNDCGQTLTIVSGSTETLFQCTVLAGVSFAGGGGGGSGVQTGSSLSQNAGQSIGIGTHTVGTFDTVNFDPSSMVNLGTDNTKINILTTGYYLVCIGVLCTPSATNEHYVYVRRNGNSATDVILHTNRVQTQGDAYNMAVSRMISMTAGDYVQLRLYFSTGSEGSGFSSYHSLDVTRIF